MARKKSDEAIAKASNDRVAIFSFISEPFTIENGLMTQTFKIRRNVVNKRYQD